MIRKVRKTFARIDPEPLTDILGGVWLVTLMLSFLHLPALFA